MILEAIMLSEISPPQKNKYFDEILKIVKLVEMESIMMVVRDCGEKEIQDKLSSRYLLCNTVPILSDTVLYT